MPSSKVSYRVDFLGKCPFFRGDDDVMVFREGDSVNGQLNAI